MSDIYKMVSELMPDNYSINTYGNAGIRIRGYDQFHVSKVVLDALLTAPPGWRLVPVEPTAEMIEAAEGAHMPFGDMHLAITSAILSAPEPKA